MGEAGAIAPMAAIGNAVGAALVFHDRIGLAARLFNQPDVSL
jgi:hypothetical protein